MLKYIGDGQFLPGIPARDLTEKEAAEHGREALLASGLYVEASKEPVKPAPKPSATEKEKES